MVFRPMFVPPRQNPLLTGLCRACLPALGPLIAGSRDLRVDPADRVLCSIERDVGIEPRPGQDLCARIPEVRRRVLDA